MAMGTQLTIKNRALAEEILIHEYSDAPETVEIQEAIKDEIAKVVDEINLGATKVHNDYLDLEVTIES